MAGAIYDGFNGGTLSLSGIETLRFTGNATGDNYGYGAGVSGGGGDDILTGLDGGDMFFGGAGNDTITGAGGDDQLDGGTGDNILDGGTGNDIATLDFSDRTANLTLLNGAVAGTVYQATVGGIAAGTITNIETLNITGGAGDDVIGGVYASAGAAASLIGGGGSDTAVIDVSAVPNGRFGGGLVAGAIYDGFNGGTLSLSGIETLRFTGNATGDNYGYGAGVSGGAGDDILTGLGGGDMFFGGAGNDRIDGGLGSNMLDGGADDDTFINTGGSDTIDGGAGADRALFARDRADYDVSVADGVVTVRDRINGAVSTLRDVETISFNVGGAITGDEDSVIPLDRAFFEVNFHDPEGQPLAAIRITDLPQGGTLRYDGVAVTVGQVIAVDAIGDDRLTFLGDANFNGFAQFGWSGADATGDVSAPVFASISVRAVNDVVGLSAGGAGTGSESFGTSFSRTVTYGDPDHDTIALTVDWGDGQNSTFTSATGQQAIAHHYADNGDYAVRLSATDSAGSIETADFAVAIANVAPTIALQGDGSVTRGQDYSLTLSDIVDPGADTVTRIAIDWGDGTAALLDRAATGPAFPTSLAHAYAATGDYAIRAMLTDEDGTFQAGTRPLTVTGTEPTATIAVSSDVIAEGGGMILTIGDLRIPQGSTVDAIVIDWGDGTPPTSIASADASADRPSHVYADDRATPYQINVTAQTNDGAVLLGGAGVTVANVAPDLAISGDAVAATGTYYTLSLGDVIDPGDDTAQAIRIDWGDGRSVTLDRAEGTPFPPSITTVYSQAGGYTISIDIIDEDGTFSAVETLPLQVRRDRANTAPVPKEDALTVLAGGVSNGSLFLDNGAGRDLDPEGDAFIVQALNGAAAAIGVATRLASGALVTLNADGSYRYDPNGSFTPAPGQSATDSFTYTIVDSFGATATAEAHVTILAQGDAADLIARDIQFAGGSANTPATISYTLANDGGTEVTTPFVERVYLSRDATISADDTLVREFRSNPQLAGGAAIERSFTARLPQATGDYFVLVAVDATDVVVEGDEANVFASATPGAVGAAYTATVTASIERGAAGQPILLSGSAIGADGIAKMPFAVVQVVVAGGGVTRDLYALTDAQGDYALPFALGTGEAGTYSFAARYPEATGADAAVEDSVDFYGVNIVAPTPASLVAGNATQMLLTVRNPGNLDLTGLTVRLSGLDAGVTGTATLASTSLAGFGETQLVVALSSTVAAAGGDDAFRVEIESGEGAVAAVDTAVHIVPLRPELAFDTAQLQEAIVRGTSEIVTVRLTNSGGAASGPLTLSLPDAPFLSLASPGALAGLAPGESTEINLLLRPAPDLPLATYNGAIAVTDASGAAATLPFAFNAVSDATGGLTVNLQDEFTFFAEGHPLVQDATVTVINAVTQETVFESADVDGMLHLNALPEGFYKIQIQAPDHDRFGATVEVKAGADRSIDAFMSLQTVKTTWSVAEVALEDRYAITVASDFLTNVPVPVVTIDPGDIDIADLDQIGESKTFTLKVTNHGLIAAHDFKLMIQDHPLYRIDMPFDTIPTIDADSSVSFDVTFTRIRDLPPVDDSVAPLARSATAAAAVENIPCFIGALAEFAYQCGPNFIKKAAQFVINGVQGNCDATGGHGGGDVGAGDLGGFFAFYAAFSAFAQGWAAGLGPLIPRLPGIDIPGEPASYYSVTRVQPEFEGCSIIKNLEPCFDLTPITEAIYVIGDVALSGDDDSRENFLKYSLETAHDKVEGEEPEFAKGLKKVVKFLDIIQCINGIMDFLGVERYEVKRIGPPAAGRYALDIAAFSAFIQSADATAATTGADAALVQAIEGARVLDQFLYDLLGEATWTELSKGGAAIQDFIGDVFVEGNASADASISDPKTAELIQRYGDQVPIDVIHSFIDRWNRTIAYNESGIFRTDQVAPGLSTDFIATDTLGPAAQDLADLEAVAADQGYADLSDYLQVVIDAAEAPYRTQNGGVCAQVTLQLDQEAVLTRQGFQGTLRIDNELPADLTDIRFDLQVRDVDGNFVEAKVFAILPPEQDGVTAIDGTGIIRGNASGVIRFTVIPTRDAAADANTVYTLGGNLSYRSGDTLLTVPVVSTPIIVVPQPELELDYFFQRSVFADDPFTAPVEPSEPFTLGLIVSNVGGGTARDLTLESGQPKIVDNEKGLLVDFNIIGTQVEQASLTPSLKVDFGDLAPGSSEVAAFQLTSSLQGHFENYEATFQHINAIGSLNLSLITATRVHELIHAGDVDGDGRPDFLANDTPDFADRPDTLYLAGGPTVQVETIAAAITDSDSGADGLKLTVRTAAKGDTWQYVDLLTPTDAQYRLASVTRADGSVVAPARAWFTDRTFLNDQTQATYEDRLHIIDDQASAFYTVTFVAIEPPNTAPVVAAAVTLAATEDVASAAIAIGASDVDGDGLNYALKPGAGPTKGAVSFDQTAGSFIYTPTANANGGDDFTILVSDGRGGVAEQAVSVAIAAVNDPAIIAGQSSGMVVEASTTTGQSIVSGQLSATDIDSATDFKLAVQGLYGSLTITPAGAWTYTLDNANPTVDALDFASAVLLDRVTVQTADGTSQVITISIQGADDTRQGGDTGSTLTGTAGADTLIGGRGDDRLDGGTGADRMVGGDGNDSYVVDDSGDMIEEVAGEGIDTVTVTASLPAYTLGPEVERLFYQGTADFAGTGNALANTIVGGAGADTLDGQDGGDGLSGGAGADTLIGGRGDDRLDGGTGADRMVGGDGNDSYVVDDASDTIEEVAGEGIDTVTITASLPAYTLGAEVERLFYKGTADFAGTGNALANTIVGGAGNDTLDGQDGGDGLSGGGGADTLIGGRGDDRLDGGTGADRMVGGDGNDSYVIDDAGDTIEEVAGEGIDTVTTALRTYTLGVNVERLFYQGTADFAGTGNALANTIVGGAGADTLDGQDGSDGLNGGAGADTLIGGRGDDRLDGGTGADRMVGGDGNDSYVVDDASDTIEEVAGEGIDTVTITASLPAYTLGAEVERLFYKGSADFAGTGNALANTIVGGAGNDTLDGQDGGDGLSGGGGADTLIGGRGDDRLDGGTGVDTAVFSGTQADHRVQTVGGRIQVIDLRTGADTDGVDTLESVEMLRFGDGTTMSLIAPIALDLDDDGVSLLPIAASTAKFDFDGDGIADRTSWVGSGDGLLFLDRDGDGTLSGAAELSFVDDVDGAASDLAGLVAFDSNGDGQLSAGDDRFAEFGVFRDKNGNGRVDLGEILSMASAGVASIGLTGRATSREWAWGAGAVLNEGGFVRTDGSTATFADVALAYQGSGGAPAGGGQHAQIYARELVQAVAMFGGDSGALDAGPRSAWDHGQPGPYLARSFAA